MSTGYLTLSSGMVSVYGLGTPTSNAVYTNNPNVVFATIVDVWDGGSPFLSTNDIIIFDKRDVPYVIYVANNPYSIVPARLATKQTPPP